MKREIDYNPEPENGRELAPVPKIEIDNTAGHLLPAAFEKETAVSAELKDRLKHAEQGLDDESKRWLSLLLDHPDWQNEVYQQLSMHKNVGAEQAEEYLEALRAVRTALPELAQTIGSADESRTADQFRNAVKSIHQQLGVRPGEAPEQVTLLRPSEGKGSGWGMMLGSDAVIASHPDNSDNMKHEYMHSFVNEWVASLTLSDKQERFIIDNSPSQLRESYGDDCRSVLAELIIRTYLYGRPRGEASSPLTERLADLIDGYKQQEQQQSFGGYLKGHFSEVVVE